MHVEQTFFLLCMSGTKNKIVKTYSIDLTPDLAHSYYKILGKKSYQLPRQAPICYPELSAGHRRSQASPSFLANKTGHEVLDNLPRLKGYNIKKTKIDVHIN